MKAMRDIFIEELYKITLSDKNVIFLSDDFGAPSLDNFRKDLIDQYINIGVAEQNMINVAAGLALEGKNVFVYLMAPFISRCYEQIKLNLCAMNLPITILGVGSGMSYSIAGPTHHALEDLYIFNTLPNISIFNPSNTELVKRLVSVAYMNRESPMYIRLDRENYDAHIDDFDAALKNGFVEVRHGTDIAIISTGTMLHTAIETADLLSTHSISVGIFDLYRIKPFNIHLFDRLSNIENVITIEENFNTIGKEINHLSEKGNRKIKHFYVDEFCFRSDSRSKLRKLYGLDSDSIARSILEWI